VGEFQNCGSCYHRIRSAAERKKKFAGESLTPGKIYLVGAGPGHPELLTVKAAKLLEASDVIIYDRLIQEEILALAKPSTERIYMGKSVGIHGSRQEEICEVLLRKAREGKTVVRLKGGDPFLFGRGGEEAEFLAEHGIPFEVVPGVSSALAAPASAGIAVTHRNWASAVAIITGHEANQAQSRLNWSALAGIDTLVFLMAVHLGGSHHGRSEQRVPEQRSRTGMVGARGDRTDGAAGSIGRHTDVFAAQATVPRSPHGRVEHRRCGGLPRSHVWRCEPDRG